MTIQEVITRFDGAKKTGTNKYQCKCPTHDDKRNSLSISANSEKILIHCHAGCNTEDILSAVGLTFEDLGSGKKNKTWRTKLEQYKRKAIEAAYDYEDDTGKYLYTKVRFADKDMVIGRIDNDFFNFNRSDTKKTLYNLKSTVAAIDKGITVYIVEGEKDVETLKSLGLTACTAGGVNDWQKEFARYFIGARVVILPDNDKPGLKLKDNIISSLRNFAYSIKWCITSNANKGDVTDYIKTEKHTKEDLLKLVESAESIFAPWIFKDGNSKEKVNADNLTHVIQQTLRYARVRRHDDDKEDFYIYSNGRYSLRNQNEIKHYIKRYLPLGTATTRALNETFNLLLCSSDNIYSDDELNACAQYINFENGLYDIKSKKLLPHDFNVLSTLQLKCKYNIGFSAPECFFNYLNDLCTDEDGNVDTEKQVVLQEWFGLLISNIPVYKVKKSLILYSPLGNTGKSQFLGLLRVLVGPDKIANIPIQNLSERFSAGSIYDKRLVMVGDQESGDIKNSSIFKQLTGGDAVSAEKKGKQPFSFVFNGGIVMACNGLPHFTDDKGSHVFDRLHIVPLTNSIPKEKQDCTLLEKMLKEREGIVFWALEGLHRLIDNGYRFTHSTACEEQIKALRSESDTLYNFIINNYTVTNDKNDRVRRSEFNSEYENWCYSMGFIPLAKTNIADRALKNGLGLSKYCGNMCYTKIKKNIAVTSGCENGLPFIK